MTTDEWKDHFNAMSPVCMCPSLEELPVFSLHLAYLAKLSLEGLGNLLPLHVASLGEHIYDGLLIGSCRGVQYENPLYLWGHQRRLGRGDACWLGNWIILLEWPQM